jgi:hypothetical protein
MELSDLFAEIKAADPYIDLKIELYDRLLKEGRIEEAHRLRATTFGDDGFGPLDREAT